MGVRRKSASGTGPARWDPELYLRFEEYRLRPALDLIARITLRSPRLVCDLGCGTGHVTRLLAKRWPSAEVCGVEASEEMLARAETGGSRIRWLHTDLRAWKPERPPDLLFSNAALHWLGGHEELFPRLLRSLNPGGCLAVQMPRSWDAPSHRLIRETLEGGGDGGTPLGTEELRREMARKPVLNAGFYYDLLAGMARGLDLWETEYLHVLTGADPVLEWVKGTALRPVLAGLEGPERGTFLAEYARRLRDAYPPRPDGRTLFPFRRLFLVATF